MANHFRAVGVATALCLSFLGLSVPLAQAAPSFQGAPCMPDQWGVTVVVDYSLDGSNVVVRCAPGANGTIRQAFESAGFVLTGGGGLVTGIDGVVPSTLYGWEGFWGLYTSTTNGMTTGGSSQSWTFAQTTPSDGPVKVDQAYLFRVLETWDCMLLDYDPSWADEMDDPSICVPTPTLLDLGLARTDVVSSGPSVTYGSPDAGQAAAWLGAQLAANGDVLLDDQGQTSWGLTIDAIFALASAGVGANQIKATAAKVYASGSQYIGTKDQIGTSWTTLAKMILGLEVAGLDPTAFATSEGTRDLIAELRSALNTDGSFGDPGTDSPFSHALAMLALARTDGGVPATAVAWMFTQKCSTGANQGSYGWDPNCYSPDPDATALAIQALKAAGVNATDLADSEAWLAAQQDSSGGVLSWGSTNTNTTGIAAQTLAGNPTFTKAAVDYIGSMQISCTTIKDTKSLVSADVGAIAYNQDTYDEAFTNGMGLATIQFIRATVQAILGLGGPGFASLTIQGVAADLPSLTCPGTIIDPDNGGPEVSTGGVVPSPSSVYWLSAALILTGALIWRKRVNTS